jgi:hypothetical protein
VSKNPDKAAFNFDCSAGEGCGTFATARAGISEDLNISPEILYNSAQAKEFHGA